MAKMYQTSGEGIRKIRYDELRKMSVAAIEGMARRNPGDELVFEVIERTYEDMMKVKWQHKVSQIKIPDNLHENDYCYEPCGDEPELSYEEEINMIQGT